MANLSSSKDMARSERILVAEDDEALGLLLQAILTGAGFYVEQVSDGHEAVKKYRQQGPFDLVILDAYMPKLDGQAALARIRELNPTACALALSGQPSEEDEAVPAWAQGFDGHLSKPFDNGQLVKLVHQLLERRGRRE